MKRQARAGRAFSFFRGPRVKAKRRALISSPLGAGVLCVLALAASGCSQTGQDGNGWLSKAKSYLFGSNVDRTAAPVDLKPVAPPPALESINLSAPRDALMGQIAKLSTEDKVKLANDYETKQNLNMAVSVWQQLEAESYKPSAIQLGRLYFILYEQNKDPRFLAESIRRVNAASEQDDPVAYYYLGEMAFKDYARRSRVDNHNQAALKWYGLAAEKGYAPAYAGLAKVYGTGGFGVERDEAEAKKWLDKAVSSGDAEAQLSVAKLYLNGWGVPRSPKDYLHWVWVAASNGNPEAYTAYGLYAQIDPKSMSPAVVDLLRQADELGNPECSYALGLAYEGGFGGLAKDPVRALEQFDKAGQLGNDRALYKTASMRFTGVGAEIDYARSVKDAMDLKEAAGDVPPEIKLMLARIFIEGGHGVEVNRRAALEWASQVPPREKALYREARRIATRAQG